MKIDWAGTAICSGIGKDSPKDFAKKSKRVVQTVQPLRAPMARKIDRLNSATEISFSITREHGTINAAEIFALTHYESLPGSGTLSLTSDDGSHTNVTASYLANAVLESADVKYNGMLSMTVYLFTGGTTQKTKP